MSNSNRKKTILLLGGHDPSGGAGIQADIEVVTQTGCHAVSVITAMTAQNTRKFVRAIPQSPAHFDEQLQTLLDDIEIDACKIGMIASAALIPIITAAIKVLDLPIVLDPVLRSGSGTEVADADIRHGINDSLLPHTTILTPNSDEARNLTGCEKLEDAAAVFINKGVKAVLITGTHEQTDDVVNSLFLNDGQEHHFRWPRLTHTYHGSGCTLASCIAAHLSMSEDLISAVKTAQDYTWHALKHGEQVGKGQWHPNRFYQT